MSKIELTVEKLSDVGAHFGHPSSKWHPNFEKFISSKKNGIHIIDLVQTEKNLIKATKELSKIINKDLSSSFVRLEIIGDKKGFWLKPHKDISEKLMTMMIWANPYNESSNLGTDLYNKDFKLVKTIKYIHNSGYLFSSGEDTWHGLELKEIKKERRCIQVNYVSFNTDWPVEKVN